MHLFAYSCLQLSLLLSLVCSGLAAWAAWSERDDTDRWCVRGQMVVAALVTLASATLVRALVDKDFSFQYVTQYTDSFLPLFYAVTAFWAGQAGSLLFWAWTVVLAGAVFGLTATHGRLSPRTRLIFWLFFMGVQAFFLFMLCGASNPFIELSPPLPEGNGLNPLLRNPGMIFHPPLLFAGYAGFTVPACLAVASWLSDEPLSWQDTARPWNLVSWALLTAGIGLGGWWSYMELGWGGYWAWDPVENASLIPWLCATAFLHTGVIQRRRGSLQRTNVFLMALTLITCFFATYLVRSGVIDSLHAFGTGGVGGPLLAFILGSTALAGLAVTLHRGPEARPMSRLVSRQGGLLLACWLLLALGGVIMMGTMWPVISSLWSVSPVGLGPDFYNRVCLPLFVLLGVILAVCPWLGWRGGLKNSRWFLAVAGIWVASLALFWLKGVHLPLALIGAGTAVACLAGIAAVFVSDASARRMRNTWAAYGVHMGLALVILGVAFSGPYQVSSEIMVEKGSSAQLAGYTFHYLDASETSSPAMAVFEARLEVSRDGEAVGVLLPQRRMFRNFQQPFAEVSVIPGLGDEIYATVLGFDGRHRATFKLAVNPLVNWVWIGCTLMSLFPFLALGTRRRRKA